MLVKNIGGVSPLPSNTGQLTTRITTCLVQACNLNLHLQLLLGRGTTQSIIIIPASSKGCCLNPKGWCMGTPNIIHSAPFRRFRYTNHKKCVPVHHPQNFSKNQDSCSDFHQEYFRSLLVVLVDAWGELTIVEASWRVGGVALNTSQQKPSEGRYQTKTLQKKNKHQTSSLTITLCWLTRGGKRISCLHRPKHIFFGGQSRQVVTRWNNKTHHFQQLKLHRTDRTKPQWWFLRDPY